METENKYLGEGKISKLLLKFSIPCILSLLISSLYNIVDQIFIGNSELGYLGNAATTVVFPITIIAVAFAWCFGDGTAAFLSLSQGRKDTKNVHKAVGNSIIVTIIISILLVIIGFAFEDNILRLFGASDTSIGLARDYFVIILSAIPIYMLANVLNPIIRADGSPKFSMASTLVGAIINIILDPIFIFAFKWGIKGAAWATIIGQIVSCIIALVYLTRTKTFKISKDSFKMNFTLFGNVTKLGISTFITQMSIVIISLVCNIMLAKYGSASKYGADIPIAVIGIAMKVFTIVINIVVGIVLGAQPILGYNYGAKKFDRVKKTFKIVIISTAIVGLISTFLFEVCPEIIIKLFGTESDLYMEFAVNTFRIFLMFVTFTCIIKVISIFFQAVGEPTKAAVVSLSRDIVCFVPLVIFLPSIMGINGALWAAPIADLIGIILSSTLVVMLFKKLRTSSSNVEEKETSLKQSNKGVIIAIAREHGSQGKYIGELVAKRLNIPYYYKEMIGLAAQESGLDKDFISKINTNSDPLHSLYLSTSPVGFAIQAQDQIIRKIAEKGSSVIVGRAADYVLRDNKNLIRIFIHAPKEYRVKKVMEMYGDSEKDAIKNIEKSDKARRDYYKTISSLEWGNASNYDLTIDSSIGNELTADIICDYINKTK